MIRLKYRTFQIESFYFVYMDYRISAMTYVLTDLFSYLVAVLSMIYDQCLRINSTRD